MADQLTIYDLFAGEEEPDVDVEALLWRPDGHRRCEHCRKRLVAWAGRLYCANPHTSCDAPDSGGSAHG